MDGSRLSHGEEHLSLAQLFTIGVGPSSSHTVGPMRAGRLFLEQISDRIAQLTRLECDLYGSLALTGVGHGTDNAVLLGLSGETPELIDIELVPEIINRIHAIGQLVVDGRVPHQVHAGRRPPNEKGRVSAGPFERDGLHCDVF